MALRVAADRDTEITVWRIDVSGLITVRGYSAAPRGIGAPVACAS